MNCCKTTPRRICARSPRHIHLALVLATILVVAPRAAHAEPRASVAGTVSGQGERGGPRGEFNDDTSPLQRGIVGARDRKWQKKSGAGSNPRCSQLIKAMARDPRRAPDDRTITRLCGVDDQGIALTEDACLTKHCVDENGAESPAITRCAQALISGDEARIDSDCLDESGQGLSDDDKKCAKAIFCPGPQNEKAIECLEDPWEPGHGPHSDELRLKGKCKKFWKVGADESEEVCGDVPLTQCKKQDSRSGGIRRNGRSVGRRIETQTILRYQRPNQRGRVGETKGAWDPFQLGETRKRQHQTPAGFSENDNYRVRSAALLIPNCDEDGNCDGTVSINNDLDCVDQVTGEHLRGPQCFDELGQLLMTLTLPKQPDEVCLIEDADGTLIQVDCCVHTNGELFYGDDSNSVADDCWDEHNNLRTTLQESIDEDPPEEPLNNDEDCKHTATGRITSDCFDDHGLLRPGFEPNVDEESCSGSNNDSDCMTVDGTIGSLEGNSCVDIDGIPIGVPPKDFIALIDEDCVDAQIDDDGDGLFDEDGPDLVVGPDEDPKVVACQAMFRATGLEARPEELPTDDRMCNISRATIVHANRISQKERGMNLFKATPSGDPDPAGEGAVEIGSEVRQVTITETFAVKCKPIKVPDDSPRGFTWMQTYFDEDNGVCVTDDAGIKSARGGVARHAVGTTCTSTDECEVDAMMGFTFAPPVLEWGVRIEEEACFLGVCAELFFARIGYEFDFAVGLRLPVGVHFEGVPDSVRAEDMLDLQTSLEPKDYTVAEYKAFCEKHHLDDPWYIASCDRFAFPDFLDSLLPISVGEMDGDEFVAKETIFAGIVVRVLGIPLINAAIDSDLDLPAICTMFKIKDQVTGVSLKDLLDLGTELVASRDTLNTLKESLANCGTFTTPFGIDPDSGELRAFPFLNASYSVRADCVDAVLNGEVVTIKGKKRPLCTRLVLGTHGASLGVGLQVDATAGSQLITADLSTAGDVAPKSGELSYTESSDSTDPAARQRIAVTADNHDDDPEEDDYAIIRLDNFTYYLNAIQIKLSANLQFGGILSPIPDIGSFTLYNFIFNTGRFGIPIGQHPGTEPVEISVLVENYGLELDVKTGPGEPDNETLQIKPGEPGDYLIKVRNIGSFPGSFDNFSAELSNRPYDQIPQPDPTIFIIDGNTDHDCANTVTGERYTLQNPYDGVGDECYDPSGNPRTDRSFDNSVDEDPEGCADPNQTCLSVEDRDDDGDGIADEDPVDSWVAYFTPQDPLITDVGAHQDSSLGVLTLSVIPFGHPLTSPGIYAFRVSADSVEAKSFLLNPRDPSGNYREGASDVAFVEVIAFYDPRIVVLPDASEVTPGGSVTYRIQGENRANVADAMDIVTLPVDFNRAGCTLVTMGSDDLCPYRAVPTFIQDEWIMGELPDHFPATPPPDLLRPLGSESSAFDITIPSDWAGMENTTYELRVTSTSVEDPETPSAMNSFVAKHTVIATLESRTRYIALEIQELIDQIEEANELGIRTGGTLPIAVHPMQATNERALARVLRGDGDRAIGIHHTNIRLTEAFIYALDGFSQDGSRLENGYYADWLARAEAIVADLDLTVGNSELEQRKRLDRAGGLRPTATYGTGVKVYRLP